MSDKRKQYIFRADDEAVVAIGEIQKLDPAYVTAPPVNTIMKRAVIELRDRLRKAAERRK